MVKMEILLPLPGTEPIPCDRHREELLSVCLASGNRRWSCYGSREQSSVTVPEHTGQIEEVSCPEGGCRVRREVTSLHESYYTEMFPSTFRGDSFKRVTSHRVP